jgi:brefeldin A-resistance guanine nucleotide exchange factor 1
MHALVRTVFSRLHSLDPEAEEARLRTGNEDIPDGEIKMTVQTTVDVEEDSQGVSVHQSNPEATMGLKSLATSRVDRPQCMSNQFLIHGTTNMIIHRRFTFHC